MTLKEALAKLSEDGKVARKLGILGRIHLRKVLRAWDRPLQDAEGATVGQAAEEETCQVLVVEGKMTPQQAELAERDWAAFFAALVEFIKAIVAILIELLPFLMLSDELVKLTGPFDSLKQLEKWVEFYRKQGFVEQSLTGSYDGKAFAGTVRLDLPQE